MNTGRRISTALIVGLLVASSAAFAQTGNQPLSPTWTRPDTDWKKYTRFLVQPLDMSQIRLVRPPWATEDPEAWTFEPGDRDLVQSIYRDAVATALSSGGGYEVVHTPAPDTLSVEAEILSIMPYLKPGSSSDDATLTLGSGELRARVELRDSMTRELLLMVEGDRVVGEGYKKFTRANNIANLEAMFTRFGKRLREAMDRVHGRQ